jgi:hypothetical protein
METKSYKQLRKQLLKDKQVNQAYKNLMSEFDLIKIIVKKRIIL